jgi:hypothetical protein
MIDNSVLLYVRHSQNCLDARFELRNQFLKQGDRQTHSGRKLRIEEDLVLIAESDLDSSVLKKTLLRKKRIDCSLDVRI